MPKRRSKRKQKSPKKHPSTKNNPSPTKIKQKHLTPTESEEKKHSPLKPESGSSLFPPELSPNKSSELEESPAAVIEINKSPINEVGQDKKSSILETEDEEFPVSETEEKKFSVLETQDEESPIPESEDNKSLIPETEDKEFPVSETEEQKFSVLETQDEESPIPESEDKKSLILETEDKEFPVSETEEKKFSVLETQDKESPISEFQVSVSPIHKSEDKKSSIPETEDKEFLGYETKEKQFSVFETQDKESSIIESKVKEFSIPEREDKEHPIPEAQGKKSLIPETEEKKLSIFQTQYKESVIPEFPVKESAIPEGEDNKCPILAAQDKQSFIPEIEYREISISDAWDKKFIIPKMKCKEKLPIVIIEKKEPIRCPILKSRKGLAPIPETEESSICDSDKDDVSLPSLERETDSDADSDSYSDVDSNSHLRKTYKVSVEEFLERQRVKLVARSLLSNSKFKCRSFDSGASTSGLQSIKTSSKLEEVEEADKCGDFNLGARPSGSPFSIKVDLHDSDSDDFDSDDSDSDFKKTLKKSKEEYLEEQRLKTAASLISIPKFKNDDFDLGAGLQFTEKLPGLTEVEETHKTKSNDFDLGTSKTGVQCIEKSSDLEVEVKETDKKRGDFNLGADPSGKILVKKWKQKQRITQKFGYFVPEGSKGDTKSTKKPNVPEKIPLIQNKRKWISQSIPNEHPVPNFDSEQLAEHIINKEHLKMLRLEAVKSFLDKTFKPFEIKTITTSLLQSRKHYTLQAKLKRISINFYVAKNISKPLIVTNKETFVVDMNIIITFAAKYSLVGKKPFPEAMPENEKKLLIWFCQKYRISCTSDYRFCLSPCCDHTTIRRIVLCYPGIFCQCYHNGIDKRNVQFFDIGLKFSSKLSHAILTRFFISIIPKTWMKDSMKLHVVFFRIFYSEDRRIHKKDKKFTKLSLLLNYYKAMYTSKAVPETLRIIYCTKFGLKDVEGDRFCEEFYAVYEFCFAALRRENESDPHVHDVLDELKELY